MRVLVVQPTGDKRGHYGLYTTKLAQALAKSGHDVTVCTNALEPSPYGGHDSILVVDEKFAE